MRILLLWLLIGLVNASDAQEFENTSYIKGRIIETQKIELNNSDFVLGFDVSYFRKDSFKIDGKDSYDTIGCSSCGPIVLASYNTNNQLIKSVKISSVMYDALTSGHIVDWKLKYKNDKILLIGQFFGAITINDNIIIDSIPKKDDFGRGFILQFDEDLNYERHFTTSGGGTIINDLTYHNGEYIMIGNYIDTVFQFQDFKLRQKYREEPNVEFPECFVLAIDADTGKPIRGKTFGGPGRSETDEILVDSNGDFYITGRSGESLFRYDLAEVKTYENFIDATLYVMKISNQFGFLDFVDFDNVYSDALGFIIDPNSNDIYISLYTSSLNGGLVINNEELMPGEGEIRNKYLVKLNNGQVIWSTLFKSTHSIDVNYKGRLNHITMHNNNIIIGSFFTDGYKVNSKHVNVDFDINTFVGIVMQLNKVDGELETYQLIAPPSYVELENFFIKPNGNYCLLTPVVETDDMHPIIEKALNNEADYMLVDMVPDLVLDNSDPFVEQKEHFTIAPNPSHGLFTIQIEDDRSSMDYHYNLMATDGRILQSCSLKGENNLIHCTECGTGMYYVQLIDKQQCLHTQKIIIIK